MPLTSPPLAEADRPPGPMVPLASWERTEWLMLLLALGLLGAILVFFLHGVRASEFASEKDRLTTQARVASDNIAFQLAAIDNLLLDIRDHWFEQVGRADRAEHVGHLLEDYRRIMPGVNGLAVLDAGGVIQADANPERVGQHFPHAQALSATPRAPDPGALYVSPPFHNAEGVWVLALSRLLTQPQGPSEGLIVATLDPDFFATQLAAVNYTQDMWSALAHGQGKLFLLAPERPGLSGLDIAQPGSLFNRHRDSGGRANVLQGISLVTGENRLMALQTLSPPQLRMSEPLVVAASRSLVAINAPWRRDVGFAALFYLLFVVGTVVPQGLRQRRRRAQFAASSALEAQLSAERDRLATLVEALQVGVWERNLLTGEGRANDQWARLTGHEAAELAPVNLATWERLVHPEDFPRCRLGLEEPLHGDRPYCEQELRLRHKDGHWVWVLGRAKVFSRTPEGRPEWVMGINMDISAQKGLQEEMARLNLELELRTVEAEAASRAKSRFLANMSHEIRTPLNAVLGLAQLLEAEAEGSRQRDMLRNIRSAGRTLLGILNDILDLSRIEAGELRIDAHPFALSDPLEAVDSLLGAMARAKQLEWRLEAPVLGDDLVGDSLRLEQILVNLVGNAIKFTHQGGISLRVGILNETRHDIRLRFEVADTGIGIKTEALDRLFVPFTQADSGITRRFGGAGLGLSICKRLIDLMGGRLGAESVPDQGSTFWFELAFPRQVRAAPASPARHEEGAAPGPRLAGARILVADDSRLNLELVDYALRREGALPTLVTDGQQALDRLAAEPTGFDAVLMDMQMPVMDGFAATRAIRTRPELAGLPVIAFSAGVLQEEQRLMFDAGVSDFVPKPVDLAQLARVLARWTGAAPALETEAAAPTPALAAVPAESPAAVAMAAPPAENPAGFPLIAGIDNLRAARHFDGDPDFFLILLGRFATDAADEVARIEANLEGDQAEAAAAALHKLKGLAGNLGATELETAARQLEAALRGGDGGDDLPGLRETFRDRAQRLLAAIGAREDGPDPGPERLAPAPQASRPVPEQRLRSLLTVLEDQLTRNRFDAKRTSQAIEALLADTDLAAAYAPVAEAAGRLRFQEALAKLAAFRPPSP
ncbi:MAG: response regulator [Chromatiaceae bacterium]|nr:response regulator [Chromatiaceae bacterium]